MKISSLDTAVRTINESAQSAASGATQTQAAARELARLAGELQSAVSQFKYDEEAHETKSGARMKGERVEGGLAHEAAAELSSAIYTTHAVTQDRSSAIRRAMCEH